MSLPVEPGEQGQSQTVVFTVVMLLGSVALLGLCGGMWLIHELGSNGNADAVRTESAQIAVVFTTVGGAVGALAGILASTRSTPSAAVAAKGYDQATADFQNLADAMPSSPVTDVVEPVSPPSV